LTRLCRSSIGFVKHCLVHIDKSLPFFIVGKHLVTLVGWIYAVAKRYE